MIMFLWFRTLLKLRSNRWRIYKDLFLKFKYEHQIFSGTFFTALVPLIRPVLLAAIRPTFWPAEAYLLMVPGLPKCLWLPPPWGWSTGFILTPATWGNLFLSLLNLWKRTPAFMIGFSFLPPPAIIPTVALQFPGMVFLDPDGNLILVRLPSSECPTIVA